MVLKKGKWGDAELSRSCGPCSPNSHLPTYCWEKGGPLPPAGWTNWRGQSTRRPRRGNPRSPRSESQGWGCVPPRGPVMMMLARGRPAPPRDGSLRKRWSHCPPLIWSRYLELTETCEQRSWGHGPSPHLGLCPQPGHAHNLSWAGQHPRPGRHSQPNQHLWPSQCNPLTNKHPRSGAHPQPGPVPQSQPPPWPLAAAGPAAFPPTAASAASACAAASFSCFWTVSPPASRAGLTPGTSPLLA